MSTTPPKQPEAFNEVQKFQQFVLTQGLAIKPSKPIFNSSSPPKKRGAKKPKNGRLWAW